MRFLLGCSVAAGASGLMAVAIFGLNHVVGSAREENASWLERQLADAVVAQRNTLIPPQIDEAALRWLTADHLAKAPEIAVFGSSHSLPINSDFSAPYHVSNFSISGASLADHLITSQFLDHREKSARVNLIVVDPWYFDRYTNIIIWTARPQQSPQQLLEMESRLSSLASPAIPLFFRDHVRKSDQHPLKVGYSLDPLFAAADNFLERSFTHLVFTERDEAFGRVLLSDGSIQEAGHHSDIDVDEARNLAIHQFVSKHDRYRYGTFAEVDPAIWMLFERWVHFLKRDNHTVLLMFSPYHPAIYPNIIRDSRNRLQLIEERVREFAATAHLTVLGSYNPDQAGMTEADFFDGDHLRYSALERLLGRTLSDAAKAAGGRPDVVELETPSSQASSPPPSTPPASR